MFRKNISAPVHEDPVEGRFRRPLGIGLFGILILILLCTQGCPPSPPKPAPPSPPAGEELFRAKCGKCHEPERALKKFRSAGVWLETINRMKTKHHADISRKEIDQLVKYHVERQKQETDIFQEKCQKCHPGKIFLERNLTPDQARAIIKRMQQKAGNTIEDKDVEIVVRYHIEAQQKELENTLNNILGRDQSEKPAMQLFLEKCSSCHNPARALSVIEDPEVWAETIKRMQFYSKGAITDQEARDLVDFHVARQQKEIDTFRQTCTKCHDDSRINSRSMSEEEWIATIKRMQKKAPELITDEKVNLLAAYFHRRELTLAKIFADKCQFCHYTSSGETRPPGSPEQLNGLIANADREFGKSLQIKDINNLLAVHVQRQRRNMQLYESNCDTCHLKGPPPKGKSGLEKAGSPARADWIAFIAALQGLEITKEVQNSINSQIDFHISRQ